MALATPMVATTTRMGMVFGNRWPNKRRRVDSPSTSVASIKSRSRSDRIWPRTSRANEGQPSRLSMIITM
ncbi:hypothetical protein D3C75_1281170 [compost metagenome]